MRYPPSSDRVVYTEYPRYPIHPAKDTLLFLQRFRKVLIGRNRRPFALSILRD
jgi:hypothetical protein